MRTIISITIILLTLTGWSQVQRKSLIKIGAGEHLMVWESNIGLGCSGQSLCVVSKGSGEEYYVYQNGVKKGPFPDAQSAMNICKESSFEDPEPVSTHFEDGNAFPDYIDNGVQFTFNNITYGPFTDMTINVSPDKKHFMAVGSKDGKFWFMSDLVRNAEIAGRALFYHWDKAGNGICVIKSGFDESVFQTTNFDGMTEAEQIAFIQNVQQQMENTVEELFVIMHNGTVSGPYQTGNQSSNNPGLSLTAQGHWVFSSGTKLFIDGKEVYDFTDMYFESGQVWLSPDATQWAVKFYDKLLFSDGSEYPYPIRVNYCNEDPSRIEWITLENENELVHYSRSW